MPEPTDLGPRQSTGIPDPENVVASGNWTVTFAPSLLAVTVAQYEVYHIALNGPGGYFLVYRNGDFWDCSLLGSLNSWDPEQPLLLRQADTVYFYWSTSTGTAPVITLWLRVRS